MNKETFGLSGYELIEKDFPDRPQFLTPWIRSQSINMVYGYRGVSKTWFCLQLIYCLASGQSFLKLQVPKRIRCIYFDGEMGKQSLQERFIKIIASDTSDLASVEAINNTKFITFEDCGGQIWNLANPRDQIMYSEAIKDYDLVVIDNKSTCMRPMGREGDVELWAKVQPWLIQERSKGKAFIIVHHAGKNLTQRGSSTIEDVMDLVINLKLPSYDLIDNGTVCELWIEKHRNIWGKDVRPLWVEMATNADDKLVWTSTSFREKQKQRLRRLKEKGLSAFDLMAAFQFTKAEFLEIWEEIDNEQHERLYEKAESY